MSNVSSQGIFDLSRHGKPHKGVIVADNNSQHFPTTMRRFPKARRQHHKDGKRSQRKKDVRVVLRPPQIPSLPPLLLAKKWQKKCGDMAAWASLGAP